MGWKVDFVSSFSICKWQHQFSKWENHDWNLFDTCQNKIVRTQPVVQRGRNLNNNSRNNKFKNERRLVFFSRLCRSGEQQLEISAELSFREDEGKKERKKRLCSLRNRFASWDVVASRGWLQDSPFSPAASCGYISSSMRSTCMSLFYVFYQFSLFSERKMILRLGTKRGRDE